MITPEILLESFESYRRGDKNFCKLASISDKNDGTNKYFGFWIEFIRKDKQLIFSVQFQLFMGYEPEKTIILYRKEHLEAFIEEARLSTSKEVERLFHARSSHINTQNT